MDLGAGIPDERIDSLPKWAQRLLKAKDRTIETQAERISVLTNGINSRMDHRERVEVDLGGKLHGPLHFPMRSTISFFSEYGVFKVVAGRGRLHILHSDGKGLAVVPRTSTSLMLEVIDD